MLYFVLSVASKDLVSSVFGRQGHGRVEEVGEWFAEIVQDKLNLLPESFHKNLSFLD